MFKVFSKNDFLSPFPYFPHKKLQVCPKLNTGIFEYLFTLKSIFTIYRKLKKLAEEMEQLENKTIIDKLNIEISSLQEKIDKSEETICSAIQILESKIKNSDIDSLRQELNILKEELNAKVRFFGKAAALIAYSARVSCPSDNCKLIVHFIVSNYSFYCL